ncbi:hypothetical protein PENTCL1PPCAC_17273, partial [Pristionchus entomophagus]
RFVMISSVLFLTSARRAGKENSSLISLRVSYSYLGQDFSPLLPSIMPILIRIASFTPFRIELSPGGKESMGYLKSGGIHEKEMAAYTITQLSEGLGSMLQWLNL